MALVDGDDATEATGHVIEQFLDDGKLYAQGCHIGRKRPAEVVQRPVGNARKAIECDFAFAPSIEASLRAATTRK